MYVLFQEGKIFSHDLGEPDDAEELLYWTRKLDDVIAELLSDPRFEGHHYYQFQLYTNDTGERVFGEANGCFSFQLHAHRIGAGTVPVSIVIFIDASFMKRKIYIRPVYGKVKKLLSH